MRPTRAAFIFLGGPNGITANSVANAATTPQANQASANVGRAVAGVGDVDNDGYHDVIVGAFTYTAGQSREGAAFLFLGRNTDLLWYNWSSGKIVLWFMDANAVRVTGQFTNPANAGNNNWNVLAMGDYGSGPAGLPDTKDIVWRNSTSGRVVV